MLRISVWAGLIFYVLAPGIVLAQTIHVPVSWCAMQGSPAESAPNIPTTPSSTQFDQSTDLILWRRHERATDFTYLEDKVHGGALGPKGATADISFRSAVTSTSGGVSFPTLPDWNTNVGQPGDIIGWPSTQLANELYSQGFQCRNRWQSQNGGGQVNGIIVLNVGRFVLANGGLAPVVGWHITGGLGLPEFIAVEDNSYRYPHAPNAGTSGITDPLDLLFGHEVGHSLGLFNGSHSSDPFSLMHGGLIDHDLKLIWGQFQDYDNNNFTQAEVTTIRTEALKLHGAHMISTGAGTGGPLIQHGNRIVANILDVEPPGEELTHLGINSVSLQLDRRDQTTSFAIELDGTIPEDATKVAYWVGIDSDGDPTTGVASSFAKSNGFGEDAFTGSDAVVKLQLDGIGGVIGKVWDAIDSEVSEIEESQFSSTVMKRMAYPFFRPDTEEPRDEMGVHLADVLSVTIDSLGTDSILTEGQRGQVMAYVTAGESSEIIDSLNPLDADANSFALDLPVFATAHLVDRNGEPLKEEIVRTDPYRAQIQGLAPNQPFHGFLGNGVDLVNGITDDKGNAFVEFSIPADVPLGRHLATFGTDNSALTADLVFTLAVAGCVVPEDAILGDFNGNGTVEFTDFLVLANNFGEQVATYSTGDTDCDGVVDFIDFLAFAESFGQAAIESNLSSVPEPSSMSLLGFCVFLVVLRKR